MSRRWRENLRRHLARRSTAIGRGCCTTSANTAPTGRSGSATRRIRLRWITLRRARSWRRGWAITMLRVPWRVITAVCRTGETRRTTAAERYVLG